MYRTLLFLVILLGSSNSLKAQIFVRQLANGTNDGSSWQNAFTDLQDALTIATEGDEIWIAKGIYTPVVCNGACDNDDRNVSFEIGEGIKLYGGFEGNENSLDQRDWEANKSILSGDIGIGGDDADNSFTLITMSNVTENTIIDGITITNANDNGSFSLKAGGIYILADANDNASPRIENCSIVNNFGERTGGIKITTANNASIRPQFKNNRFENNRTASSALGSGGAVNVNVGQGTELDVSFLNCSFIANVAGSNGGAISINVTSIFSDVGTDNLLAVIDSCHFENNQVVSTFERGAAIYIRGLGIGSMQSLIRNSTFIGNQSSEDGGAIAIEGGKDNFSLTSKIFNNHFLENTAGKNGGALMLQSFFNDEFNVQIANNIFNSNQAQSFGGAIFSNSSDNQEGSKNVDVINNTFSNNIGAQAGLAIYNSQFNGFNEMDVVNNIFAENANNGDDVIGNNGGTVTMGNNLIKAGLPANITDNGNNIFTDPEFFNIDLGDFHLRTSSPAINSGDNNSVLDDAPFDFDGNLRIRHETVDMGAYETGAIFVDQNATGNNNGLSWQDAFVDLQSALAATKYNKEIWVAQGTYFPTTCQDDCTEEERAISFHVPDSVRLFGGFNATENEREQRNWEQNSTILSGDIGIENDSTDNTYSVIMMQNSTPGTTIDGFIIEKGHADASGIDAIGSSSGGGINVEMLGSLSAEVHVHLSNLIIRNNFGGGGGGIRMTITTGVLSPQFNNILFENNSSSLLNVTSFGGAVMLSSNSFTAFNPVFLNCVFKENRCGNDGGALATLLGNNTGNATSPSLRIDSCVFENNVVTGVNSRGGAIYSRIIGNITTQSIISNTLFENNKAEGHGGAVFDRASFAPALASNLYINCTFNNNQTDQDGGAMYIRGSQEATNDSRIINSIFNNNKAQLRGGATFNQGSINGDGNNLGVCIPQIINNTFFNNIAETEGNSLFNEFASPVIGNNIIWGGNDQIGNNNATPSLLNNIVEGGYSGTGNQVNTTDEDPQFVNTDATDFSVSPCSPAINAGDNDIIQQTNTELDFNGNERVFDEIVDIGAIEWNGVPARLDSIGFSVTHPSFESACDGQIEAEPFRGTPDYSFLWSTGEAAASIDALCEGTYILTVTDALGCQFTDSVELIAIPNTLPEITSDSIVTATEDQPYVYAITALDPDTGDALTIVAENLPDWLELIDHGDGTATLSGIPENEDVGLYNITIVVNDSRGGTDEQKFDLEVINVNDPPEFTSIPDTIALVGTEYIYTIESLDIDENDILSITMPFVPSWLSFEDLGDGTAILSGTAQLEDVGSYAISLIVTDLSGANDLQFFNLVVTSDNNTPEFTSIPITSAIVGETYSYEISATDADGHTLDFSMPFVPGWLSFTDNGNGTALLEGIPQSGDIGNYTIQILVEDELGAATTQDFEIIVSDPTVVNAPPQIIPVNLETQEDQALIITLDNFKDGFADNENNPISKIYIETLPTNGILTLNGNQLFQGTAIDALVAFELIYIPNDDFNGTDQWLWNADDGELKAADETSLTVVVNPVNDAPTDLNIDNQTIAEDALVGDLVGTLTTQDVDLDDVHTYFHSSAGNDNASFFNIENDQLVLARPLDFDLQATYEIQITVEDSAGASFTATFTIAVEPVENDLVTNAITPNGDGKNDEWLIPEIENCNSCKVEIYNRWGQMVYSSIGYNIPWDGHFNQKTLPTGTYYYLIDFNGEKTKTGTVSILK
ncbi:gliding motility-associated C-terminal domain-containing protein [Fulvivirgaceae bacterium BMA12]|uniref:Gliding motility-associated C-terminal domain-containing protein n=1 Tax=Agaribacillus aureus TaxID=3051825 RepID=A0ABT8L3J8_9BACT|nr:gliding motility-associated C-terminal domain-containing protein [Fulvivirgaceae bacterium BMA12]